MKEIGKECKHKFARDQSPSDRDTNALMILLSPYFHTLQLAPKSQQL